MALLCVAPSTSCVLCAEIQVDLAGGGKEVFDKGGESHV